jgi:hypothetical protein
MKTELKYIELKSGFSHDGPAWIGLVSFSKSGKTVYFDGKAFQRIGSDRMMGNFYEIQSGDEYWISGVKKNQSDRHIYGNGKIYVERRVLSDYLKIINQAQLNSKKYEIVEVDEVVPISKIHEMENQLDKFGNQIEVDVDRRLLNPHEFTDAELEFFINYFDGNAKNGKFLKGRKFSRLKRDELIIEQVLRREKEAEL